VVIDLNIVGAQSTRSQGTDTLNSIESVSGSQFNDVITGDAGTNDLTGNGGNDVLYGRGGSDTLIGGDGDDRFYGGSGNDTLTGGDGIDTAIYDDASGAITVDLSLTGMQKTGAAGYDQLSGIERLTGSRNADTFTGDSANNVIYGHRGNDLIHGAGGDDRIMGDQDSDTLFGDSGNDRLYGRTGDDQLHGGDGNDRLYGEDGDDLFDGGAGTDIAYYSTATAGVTVNLGIVGAQDTVSNGFDTLVGIERIIASAYDDHLTGSNAGETFNGQNGNDAIDGGGGRDYIFGEAGNDIISGGLGNDRLYGGAGQDNFRFDTLPNTSTNWDYISDYSVADDTIQLSQAVFSTIDSVGALSAAEFRLGSAAADASDRIIYDQARGYIYYDADGNGAGHQVLFARVAAGTALTNADFSVFGTAQASLDSASVQTALADTAKSMPTADHASYIVADSFLFETFHAATTEHYII
jgi:serralysin